MKRIIIVLLLVSGLVCHAFSQTAVSASAGVKATIVEPVGISKSVDSEYGNVGLILAGTIMLTPSGRTSKSGTILLPVTSGTYTVASFCFSGNGGYTYTITVPETPIAVKRGANILQVASFTSDPALIAGSGLTAGVFVSVSPFNVVVNYN